MPGQAERSAAGGHGIPRTNPQNLQWSRPRRALIRIVFVDFSGIIQPLEMCIDPTTSWNEFLSHLTSLTAPVTHLIPGINVYKLPGYGLTLADGDWHYRLIKTFDYDLTWRPPQRKRFQSDHADRSGRMVKDTNRMQRVSESVHRSGIDAGEWTLLNCETGYTRMIDRMTYGYHLEGAWIEIQHHLQTIRDQLNWTTMQAGGGGFATLSNIDRHPGTNEALAAGYQYTSQDMTAGIPKGASPEVGAVAEPTIVDGGRRGPRRSESQSTNVHDITKWKPPVPLDQPLSNFSHQSSTLDHTNPPLCESSLPPMYPAIGPTSIPIGEEGMDAMMMAKDFQTPRVHMPMATGWSYVDGKLVDNEGKEIVFGSWGGVQAVETAKEQSKSTYQSDSQFEHRVGVLGTKERINALKAPYELGNTEIANSDRLEDKYEHRVQDDRHGKDKIAKTQAGPDTNLGTNPTSKLDTNTKRNPNKTKKTRGTNRYRGRGQGRGRRSGGTEHFQQTSAMTAMTETAAVAAAAAVEPAGSKGDTTLALQLHKNEQQQKQHHHQQQRDARAARAEKRAAREGTT